MEENRVHINVFMNNIVMTHVRSCVHAGVHNVISVFARIIEGKEGV